MPESTSSTTTTDQPKQVQVRFHTRQKRFEVTDAAIMVPTSLRRFGLSEIINHLLNLNSKTPFDFIIDGKFLRTSLGDYLDSHNLSAENILDLEYVKSSLPPNQGPDIPHDDWVSAVDGPGEGDLIATGCYDGNTRLWSMSGSCVATLPSSKSVKAVAWLSRELTQILSGGEDNMVTLWQYNKHTGDHYSVFEGIGHTGSINSISVGQDKQQFATASWDASIKIWNVDSSDFDESIPSVEHSKSNKKKRIAEREVPKKESTLTLEGHVGSVSAIEFSKLPGGNTTLYSGGFDHSVRVWDIESNSNVHAMNCEKVILCLDHSSQNGLIATGHADSIVRLWDPRDQKGLVVKLKLSSHKNMVSSVSWAQTGLYSLASGSYDSQVKLWDIRSSTPLHNIKGQDKEDNKVLTLCWDSARDMLLAGGEDGKLRTFNYPL